jgi:potassium/hydrogen antiporter
VRRLTSPIPLAAVFLVAAALASDAIPALEPSIGAVELVATVALVVILFDGGASIGRRRFRAAAVPILSLGVLGTFATAGLVTAFAHWAFGLGWVTSGLLGAAVAPTDPAVMFSVLGDGDTVTGRTKTILEGESGANDPVGIGLMLGLIELALHHGETFWVVVRVFTEQMGIGLAVGLAGGWLEGLLLRNPVLPATWMRTVRSLVLAGVIYVAADLAGGSGFLAVFVAGVLVGDIDRPKRKEMDAIRDRLASAAEIVVFVALGLTIPLTHVGPGRWGQGLLLALVVAFVARPLVVGALLQPVRLRAGERLFVVWAGLKGAVPILLAAFALGRHVPDGQRLYETVFVVVLASVVVQGGSVPAAARRLLSTQRDERAA